MEIMVGSVFNKSSRRVLEIGKWQEVECLYGVVFCHYYVANPCRIPLLIPRLSASIT